MTRTITNAIAFTAATLLGATGTDAQHVDIGLYQTGNELEVRLKPSQDFDGLLSAVVFTVRWERAMDAKLKEHRQKSAEAVYIPIARAGEVQEDGPFNYQIYAGFGFDLMSQTGEGWKAGQEYTIATIPYSGTGAFHLVNDSWTAPDANNGDFYVSLNGEDRTGSIYKGMAAVVDEQVVSITPNPSHGIFTLHVPAKSGDLLGLEIVNAAGQVVFSDEPRTMNGAYRKQLDLTAFGSGNYHLRLVRNGVSENHTVVVQQ